MDSMFALDQVTSAPKEQHLAMLFNEGENSQVKQRSLLYLLLRYWYLMSNFDMHVFPCSSGFEKRLCAKHHVDV